jgi:hypothetical protein
MPPTLGDGLGDRENPTGVPGTHIHLKPVLQRVPFLAGVKGVLGWGTVR